MVSIRLLFCVRVCALRWQERPPARLAPAQTAAASLLRLQGSSDLPEPTSSRGPLCRKRPRQPHRPLAQSRPAPEQCEAPGSCERRGCRPAGLSWFLPWPRWPALTGPRWGPSRSCRCLPGRPAARRRARQLPGPPARVQLRPRPRASRACPAVDWPAGGRACLSAGPDLVGSGARRGRGKAGRLRAGWRWCPAPLSSASCRRRSWTWAPPRRPCSSPPAAASPA